MTTRARAKTQTQRSDKRLSMRERLTVARSGGKQIVKPSVISPYLGLDPELAAALAESFPAPNPDLVKLRRLRNKVMAGANKEGKFSVYINVPAEVLAVVGWRTGDSILVSAWAEGVCRLTRVPEGRED